MERRRSGYTPIPGSADVPRKAQISLRKIAIVRDFLPVPLDVFDRLALHQEPEELAVYLQLFRLAVGEGTNACRVSRTELERRVRMSQLRLGKALAGLVEKRHIALLDRTREGTLYQVMLPDEVFDQPTVGGAALAPLAPRAPPSAAPNLASVGDLAKWFLERAGRNRQGAADEVLEELLGLLEEGHTLETLRHAAERFLSDAPKRTPIAELRRYLTG